MPVFVDESPVKRRLIAETTRHVTAGMTPSGHLAYGLPFVYRARQGSGAVATSVSGLAALAMFWSRCIALARKRDYPSKALFREVLFEEAFENLFRVIPVLSGSRRLTTATEKGKKLEGWASDRTSGRRRVESWVSVDVLQFGVFVRDLIHEMLQMLVLDECGARLPTNAPRWPYKKPRVFQIPGNAVPLHRNTQTTVRRRAADRSVQASVNQAGLAALAARKTGGAKAVPPVRRTQEGVSGSANAHEQGVKCSTKKSRTRQYSAHVRAGCILVGAFNVGAFNSLKFSIRPFHGSLDICLVVVKYI